MLFCSYSIEDASFSFSDTRTTYHFYESFLLAFVAIIFRVKCSSFWFNWNFPCAKAVRRRIIRLHFNKMLSHFVQGDFLVIYSHPGALFRTYLPSSYLQSLRHFKWNYLWWEIDGGKVVIKWLSRAFEKIFLGKRMNVSSTFYINLKNLGPILTY